MAGPGVSTSPENRHARTFGQIGESEPLVGRALSGGGGAWGRMRELGVREFLNGARRRGLIRFTGFSSHGSRGDFPRIVDEYGGWDFAQLQYNYLDSEFQAGYAGLRYAADRGLGAIVMGPLKGGRPAGDMPPELGAVFARRREGWSPAEWALRYVWNESGVGTLLAGMNEEPQLEENLRVADRAAAGVPVPDQLAVYEEARAALRSRVRAGCTSYRYCQPCPQELSILIFAQQEETAGAGTRGSPDRLPLAPLRDQDFSEYTYRPRSPSLEWVNLLGAPPATNTESPLTSREPATEVPFGTVVLHSFLPPFRL